MRIREFSDHGFFAKDFRSPLIITYPSIEWNRTTNNNNRIIIAPTFVTSTKHLQSIHMHAHSHAHAKFYWLQMYRTKVFLLIASNQTKYY